MNDVTRILSAIEQGDAQAAERLWPLVYDELRRPAARKLAQEKPGQTLQATALVHEAYLRLVDDQARRWESRGHFFAAAAEAMRRILVENARAKKRLKRGGGLARREFDPDCLAAPERPEALLALDEALTRLAGVDRQAAEVVQLRVFHRLDGQGGRQGPERLTANRRSCLGLRPRLAPRRAARRTSLSAGRDLRECLPIREAELPDDWRRFNTSSLLGGSLLGQTKYAKAEPLIVSGYEGMTARQAKIPAQSRRSLAEAAERVVKLYEAWGKPEKAAAWRETLIPPKAEVKSKS